MPNPPVQFVTANQLRDLFNDHDFWGRDGRTQDDWQVSFSTRPAHGAGPARGPAPGA